MNLTTIFIGPLTSAAKLLRSGTKIANLVIMGCSIPEVFQDFPGRQKGNTLNCAEFNIACDPRSARFVFESQQSIKIIDWCLTVKYVIDADTLYSLHGESKLGRFHRAVVKFYAG